MSGKLVILSGPSGVGKDTVINEWRKINPLVDRVVAYTTRQMREGEVDGQDYHFVTNETFSEMAQDGYFLEFKLVHQFHYATPKFDMEQMVKAGKVAILKIDVQGAIAARALVPDARLVFVLPPSLEELDRRIRGRGTEPVDVIERRLQAAHEELEWAPQYDLQIVNQDAKQCAFEINQWVIN